LTSLLIMPEKSPVLLKRYRSRKRRKSNYVFE
jgi:hypothetical protein